MSRKKAEQLGMNPSTASHRLVKDLLWNFIVKSGLNFCCKCDLEMERDTFSIEHKIPWLDSDDPEGLFFDIENIGFSHKSCNFSSGRRGRRIYKTKDEAYQAQLKKDRESKRKNYCKIKRREKYLNTGI